MTAMRMVSGAVVTLLLLGAATAGAQEWHESELSLIPAILPDGDNDGPGNRMGTATCDFVMPYDGQYTASLLVYSSLGMPPYGSARIHSAAWQRLDVSGQLAQLAPQIGLNVQCMNPDNPATQEAIVSPWFAVGFDEPTPHVECPADKPVLVQAWCSTEVWW